MKYLGIDYGKKKIGLSISEGITASPFKVLEVASLKDALEKIAQIIGAEGVDRVVIGMPESGEARSITQKFIFELKRIPSPRWDIVEVEETLSSKNAATLMVDLGVSKSKRKKEDAVAAALLLQDYLDSLK